MWALILTYPTFLVPFCTWLLTGYFQSIPRELEESALIDGASRMQAMLRIVVPLRKLSPLRIVTPARSRARKPPRNSSRTPKR